MWEFVRNDYKDDIINLKIEDEKKLDLQVMPESRHIRGHTGV